jgi:hypothetical protein
LLAMRWLAKPAGAGTRRVGRDGKRR